MRRKRMGQAATKRKRQLHAAPPYHDSRVPYWGTQPSVWLILSQSGLSPDYLAQA